MEKKHLTAIIGVLIVAFGVYAYYYPPTKEKDQAANSMQLMQASGEKGTVSPSKLRYSLIQEMVTNYKQNQLKDIENSQTNAVPKDAYSILFDLDTLKKFITDIETAVKTLEPKVNNQLAIRMYYAAYPVSSKWTEPGYKNLKGLLGDEITKLYERKHTLIMIPVIKNKLGIFADFNPLDINTYQGFKKKSANRMQLMPGATDTSDIPALNHGQLIPPASNQGEAF